MAEWRKVTNTIGETGQPDREETTYEFGAEIDGTWVAYGAKSEGYIDHLIANQKARDAQERKNRPQQRQQQRPIQEQPEDDDPYDDDDTDTTSTGDGSTA